MTLRIKSPDFVFSVNAGDPPVRARPPLPAVRRAPADLRVGNERAWTAEDITSYLADRFSHRESRFPGWRTVQQRVIARDNDDTLTIEAYLLSASPECCRYTSSDPEDYCACETWTLAELPIGPAGGTPSEDHYVCSLDELVEYTQWVVEREHQARHRDIAEQFADDFQPSFPAELWKWWYSLTPDDFHANGLPRGGVRDDLWRDLVAQGNSTFGYYSDLDADWVDYLPGLRHETVFIRPDCFTRAEPIGDRVDYGYTDWTGEWSTVGEVTVTFHLPDTR